MQRYTQSTPNSNKFSSPAYRPGSRGSLIAASRLSRSEKELLLPVTVRAATSAGRFGSVYVRTRDGVQLWARSESRRGRFEGQFIEARKGLFDADPLGALVRNAEAAGNSATGQGRRAA
jgi:hypothetical protein